tara:strand:+ start:369 stop:671 length:303 start_codon:yes stop_codon:yes gene_type:complete
MIRASGNVSSIIDNGTGDYTVNFATAMPDVNYSYSGMMSNTNNNWSTATINSTRGVVGIQQKGSVAPTTTACAFQTMYGASASASGAFYDFSQVTIEFFR